MTVPGYPFRRAFSGPLFLQSRERRRCFAGRSARAYRINPASRGSVRLISGMQMISSSPMNSASMYGT